MKLMHLSDLHLGKRLHEFSMLEDQESILKQITQIAIREKIDGIMIAGDIYDKQVPPTAAVLMFDRFLTGISDAGIAIYIIAGNHDSPERLSFGGRLMKERNVYIAPVFQGKIFPVTVNDAYGPLHIYMLPFVKPAYVKSFYPEAEIADYTDAVRCVVEDMEISPGERNILMAHQFVAGSSRCESEEIAVGGLDAVEISCMLGFDYVALGHLHGPQCVHGKENIRYCGSPLKYSFSEVHQKKKVLILELKEKGDVSIEEIALMPRYGMEQIRGTYDELVTREFYSKCDRQGYIQAVLTDEEEIPEAFGKLRTVYPRICSLTYANRTTEIEDAFREKAGREKTPFEYFEELFRIQNHREMSREQSEFLHALMEKIWEEGDS